MLFGGSRGLNNAKGSSASEGLQGARSCPFAADSLRFIGPKTPEFDKMFFAIGLTSASSN